MGHKKNFKKVILIIPSFIIIGAQKSGTTTLMNQLYQHPDIFILMNDIAYFSTRYHKGQKWYEKQFKNYSGQKAVGEKTPNYLHIPEAAIRIHNDIPNVKLIFILRDPVKRAYSHYWLLKQYDDEKLPFEKAVWTKNYIERGMYAKHLERYQKLFSREQMLILTLKELKENPVDTFKKIFEFLDVDSSFVLQNPNKKFLEGGQPRTRILAKSAKVCRFGFYTKKLHVKIVMFNTKKTNPKYPPMNEDIKKKLYEYFKPYNEELKKKYPELDIKW